MNLEWASGELSLSVVLDQAARELMEREARRSRHLETGGLLLGRYAEDGRCALIKEATPPPPDSKRTPLSFQRGVIGLNELLEQRWKGPGDHYLGEWHYHPYAAPVPSPTDQRTMHGVSRNPQSRCDSPVLIIIGGAPARPEYRVHILRDDELYRLRPAGNTPPERKARWWQGGDA